MGGSKDNLEKINLSSLRYARIYSIHKKRCYVRGTVIEQECWEIKYVMSKKKKERKLNKNVGR